ncbi:NlpC/P60 family peptidoglycan-binding protein RipD [soil metagenome]
MRRVFAVVISVALLAAPAVMLPGLATARPAGNQKYIDVLIARGLSQRGVPFAYGGGDANGPSLGTPSTPDLGEDPAATGLSSTAPVAPAVPLLPAAPVVPLAPAAAPVTPMAATAPVQKIVGFDASGLMVYSYAGVGVKLPRSSGEQYNAGQHVLPAEALPGDLLFYGPDGSQSVAMFIGNGQMLEVSDSGVTVSPVRTANMTPYLTRIIQ